MIIILYLIVLFDVFRCDYHHGGIRLALALAYPISFVVVASGFNATYKVILSQWDPSIRSDII